MSTQQEPDEGATNVLKLRFGLLRQCALSAVEDLSAAATAAWPESGFTVSGKSGLQFLLDPDSACWEDGAKIANEPVDGNRATIERTLAQTLDTLRSPDSWVEELIWRDGPAVSDVDLLMQRTVSYVGVGSEDGLGEAGQVYRAHFLRRLYSAEAWALCALAHHEDGRTVLNELQVPQLPAPLGSAALSFTVARGWLAGADLQWLTPDHEAHGLLRVLVRLMPATSNGIVEPDVIHRAVCSGLLEVALGVHAAPEAA